MSPSFFCKSILSWADFSSFSLALRISLCRAAFLVSLAETRFSSSLLFCRMVSFSRSTDSFVRRISSSCFSRAAIIFCCLSDCSRLSFAACESFSTSDFNASRFSRSLSSDIFNRSTICASAKLLTTIASSFCLSSCVAEGISSKFTRLIRLSTRKSQITISMDLLIYYSSKLIPIYHHIRKIFLKVQEFSDYAKAIISSGLRIFYRVI